MKQEHPHTLTLVDNLENSMEYFADRHEFALFLIESGIPEEEKPFLEFLYDQYLNLDPFDRADWLDEDWEQWISELRHEFLITKQGS